MLISCLLAVLLCGVWPASGRAVPDPPASAPTHQFTSQQVAQLRDLSATLTSSADAPAPAPTQRIFRDGAATAHTALAALSPSRAPASEFSVAQQQALAAVIEAYERGVQAPAQGIGAGQSRAARAEFAPAPAPANASGNASGSMTYPAQGPDPAQELTPAQRAAIKKVFSPPSAGKEDAGGDITYPAQAPDAAQELTPAQRAAIRGIFSPPSAGKEDDGGAITYPAHAPDPSEHLTPAQREQLRRIFADSPLASPPSSGDTNSSSLAAGVRGGAATAAPASSMPTEGSALAPALAASAEAEDMAAPGEAAPAAWPQTIPATKQGGSAALVQALMKAPGPAIALQQPFAEAPGPLKAALPSAAASAPQAAAYAPEQMPTVSLQASSGSEGASNPADSVKAAAKQVQSFLSSGANSSAAQQNSTGFALPAAHKNSTSEAKAIGNLVAGSVQLGADLAESGHAVSLAAEERAVFVEKLKADFESLSLAIANLPVGLIPFPDRAKVALQQLNTDVVHGVSSGNLNVEAIAQDNHAVQASLGVVLGGKLLPQDVL